MTRMILSKPAALAGLLSVGVLLIAVAPAAADKSTPDWPCVQRKVVKLTSAQLWDGPPVDDLAGWRDDGEITKLVGVLENRRLAMDETKKAIDDYIKSVPKEQIDAKLKLVFAGLIAKTNEVRSVVLEGIERFQKRQAARAKELERQGLAIAKLVEKGDDAETKKQLGEAQEKFDWDTRVFTERQQNLPMACEIPVLIEQRIFEIGRVLRSHMTS